jgi:hypothetical protein
MVSNSWSLWQVVFLWELYGFVQKEKRDECQKKMKREKKRVQKEITE